MKAELKAKKFEEGRSKVIQMLKECMDVNGVINITSFRNKHRTEYNKLSQYFGTVDAAIEEIGAVKMLNSRNIPTLSQRLAYDMIKEMSKTYSVAEIARKYGVSRACVNQLYKRYNVLICDENEKEGKEVGC